MNRGMSWDSQCAFCHLTSYRKDDVVATDSSARTGDAMRVSGAPGHGGHAGSRSGGGQRGT